MKKPVYHTVGPTQLHPAVKPALEQALSSGLLSTSHRSSQFQELFHSTKSELFKLFRIPSNVHMFVVGSGTEGMERTIENLTATSSHHIITGSFGKRWYQTAQQLGRHPTKTDLGKGLIPTTKQILAPKNTEMIALTVNETSLGIYLNESYLKSLRKKYPHTIICADVVSAVPFASIDMEVVDAAFFSVQKGFGLPAGLGIMIVSDRALSHSIELEKHGYSTGSFHSFNSMANQEHKEQTNETPNILGLTLLQHVAQNMNRLGRNQIIRDTTEKARIIYDYLESSQVFSPFVLDKNYQSPTTIVVKTTIPPPVVIEALARQGIVVSSGYSSHKLDHIRLANFPAHTQKHIINLVSALRTVEKDVATSG